MLFWSSINFPNTARLRNVEMFIIGNFFNEDVKQKKWDKNDFLGRMRREWNSHISMTKKPLPNGSLNKFLNTFYEASIFMLNKLFSIDSTNKLIIQEKDEIHSTSLVLNRVEFD